jgi:hypothetical protein
MREDGLSLTLSLSLFRCLRRSLPRLSLLFHPNAILVFRVDVSASPERREVSSYSFCRENQVYFDEHFLFLFFAYFGRILVLRVSKACIARDCTGESTALPFSLHLEEQRRNMYQVLDVFFRCFQESDSWSFYFVFSKRNCYSIEFLEMKRRRREESVFY